MGNRKQFSRGEALWLQLRALLLAQLERDEGLEVHKTKQLYIAGTPHPNKKVDITDYLETQINALREHKSQIKDIDDLAARLRERKRDPESPDDAPRHIESFYVVTLR